MPKVALVNMPFALAMVPSLGLSLLKACLGRRNIDAEVIYPSIWFAHQTRNRKAARKVMECNPHVADLAGEWIFAEACFGPDPEKDQHYLESILRGDMTYRWSDVAPELVDGIVSLRDEVPTFLDHCMSAVDWGQFRVVGFTMMFHQVLASLALAKRIKERYPDVLIALGGSHCEGSMGRELIQTFPYVDLVCSGEGDDAFPEAVDRYLKGKTIGPIPGILHRGDLYWMDSDLDPDDERLHTSVVHNIDDLPCPEMDDFFREYAKTDLADQWGAMLFFETARGCWWGEKNPCHFCGLNGTRSTFRSKHPDRALAEIQYLHERYAEYRPMFQAVDNILDYRYLQEFIPKLNALGLNQDIFYEVKANLTEAQVQALAEAGVTTIQPGIESLSTSVLRLMHKGVTKLQVIQLLKSCEVHNVEPSWNMLCAFPGESPEEYTKMAELIPYLTHLAPPWRCGPVRFDRFSTYFRHPEAYGIDNLRPYPAYKHVFRGVPEKSIAGLASYFIGDYANANAARSYATSVVDAVAMWRQVHDKATLFSCPVDDSVLYVQDCRPVARQQDYLFTGLDRWVLEATRQQVSKAGILHRIEQEAGASIAAADLDEVLWRMIEYGLVVEDDGSYLCLVVPLAEEEMTEEGLQQLSDIRSQVEADRRATEMRA